MLLVRGLPDALGLSGSSPSLSVSDNWASSSLELWELSHFSSDSDCSSLLLSSARQLLVLRRVLDKRITWSFSHSFLNRWTGPDSRTIDIVWIELFSCLAWSVGQILTDIRTVFLNIVLPPGFLYSALKPFCERTEWVKWLTDKNAWTTSALTVLKGFSLVMMKKGSCLGCELCPNIKWPNQERFTMSGDESGEAEAGLLSAQFCDNFFLWNLGEPTIACLKVASRVLQGLPGGVVAWCVGDSGGLERGLSCCRWLHGWCLGLTCTKGLTPPV